MTPHSLPSQVTPSCKYQADIQPYLLHRATPIHLLFFLLFLFFFSFDILFFPLFFLFGAGIAMVTKPFECQQGFVEF